MKRPEDQEQRERGTRSEPRSAGVPAAAPGTSTETRSPHGLFLRYLVILLAAWILLSAFILPHGRSSQMNSWIVGALMVGIGVGAIRSPLIGWASAVLALWLLASPLFIEQVPNVAWNNAAIGAAVFVISLVAVGQSRRGGRQVARRFRVMSRNRMLWLMRWRRQA